MRSFDSSVSPRWLPLLVALQLGVAAGAFLLLVNMGALDVMDRLLPPHIIYSDYNVTFIKSVILLLTCTTIVPLLDMVCLYCYVRWLKAPPRIILADMLSKSMIDRWPEAYQVGSEYHYAKPPGCMFVITTLNKDGSRIIVGHGIRIRDYVVTLRHVIAQPVDLWVTVMSYNEKKITVPYDAPLLNFAWKDLPGALDDVCYAPYDPKMQLKDASLNRAVPGSLAQVVSGLYPFNASVGPMMSEYDSFAVFRHKASTKPGWSGCPVMSQGQVVGIHAGGGCYTNYAFAVNYIAMVLRSEEATDEIALRSVLQNDPKAEYRVNYTNDPDIVEIEVGGQYYRLEQDVWHDIQEDHAAGRLRRRRARRYEYDDECTKLTQEQGTQTEEDDNLTVIEVEQVNETTQTVSPPADLLVELTDVGDDTEESVGPAVVEYTMSGNLMSPLGGATRADPVSLLQGATRLAERAHRSQQCAVDSTVGLSELQSQLEDRLNDILATVKKQGEELSRQTSENAKLLAQFSRLSTKFESLTTPNSTPLPRTDLKGSNISAAPSTSKDRPESACLADIKPLASPSGGTDCNFEIEQYTTPSETQCSRGLRVLYTMTAQIPDSSLLKILATVRKELALRSQRRCELSASSSPQKSPS